MLKKRTKSVLVNSLVFALISCTSTVPNNNPLTQKENFQDLDNEYNSLIGNPDSGNTENNSPKGAPVFGNTENQFTIEALTQSYLKRKLNKWLCRNDGDISVSSISCPYGENLVKEISYARYKHPATFCEIVTEDSTILDAINEFPEVLDRSSIDTAFREFLVDCNTINPDFVGEFQVNSYTTERQFNPSIGMDDQGDFVISWQSYGQDGSVFGIYAQRYNSLGVPQGSEFQVNIYTTGHQGQPSIAMDSDGDFVITWDSYEQYSVFAQRYNSFGVPQGSEFRVNTFTTYGQSSPSIAMDNDGDFVISWLSGFDILTGIGQDGNSNGIYAQRYNSFGVPQGTEFKVNTYTTGSQDTPSIAMDNDGDFVISWGSGNTSLDGQDGSQSGVFAQMYNSSGVPQGTEFRVNTYTTSQQAEPSIAMDSDGDFVITWRGDGYSDNLGIFAQRYNTAGVPQGSEFRVNTYTSEIQRESSVSMDSTGNFVITWHSGGFTGQDPDGDRYGIFAQRYNAAGGTVGSEFQVNTYTTNMQVSPAIAMDNDGDFVISWTSFVQDAGTYGVYGQRYNSSGVRQ
jgi:hypothetical protein